MKHIKVGFYRDIGRQWRWHAHSSNGNLIACCGEGYRSKASAVKGWNSLVKHILTGQVSEV